MQFSTKYIMGFALVLCLISSTLLSIVSVGLKEQQELNRKLDKQKSVLVACNIIKKDDTLSDAEWVAKEFANFEAQIVNLSTGEIIATGEEAKAFDPDLVERVPVESNSAQIIDVPKEVRIFLKKNEAGELDQVVFPVYGNGLWGTMYGFLSLKDDYNTVSGITYYNHKETPGLGGEVDNPIWKGLWPDRKVFDTDGNVAIAVIKGAAGPQTEDPHSVDGLSGATITSRGVSAMMQYWFGEKGYGPYLEKIQEGKA